MNGSNKHTAGVVLFDRPIVEISEVLLLEAFKHVLQWDESGACISGFTKVTRAIIDSEMKFPSDTGIRDLRDIWYSSVKPVFSKLGMLRKPLKSKMSEQAFLKSRNDELEKGIGNLVKAGELNYRDIGIIDHSRDKAPATDYIVRSLPGYTVSFGINANIVLATEKNTQYAELERIASLYGCSVISGSGQGSLAAMEGLLEQILDKLPIVGGEIVFLAFTDYDGFGYEISNTFEEQMKYCVKNARVRKDFVSGELIDVRVERLGLNIGQLTSEQEQSNKYELAVNPVNKKWFEKTGGVNGEFFGIELNAMKHPQRIKIITDGLNEHIKDRVSLYGSRIRDSYIKKIAIESIDDIISSALTMVTNEERGKIEIPIMTLEKIQERALSEIDYFNIEADDSNNENIASNMKRTVSRLLKEAIQ